MTKKLQIKQLNVRIKFNTAMADAVRDAANGVREIVANEENITLDVFRDAMSVAIAVGVSQKKIASALPEQTPANVSRWVSKGVKPNVLIQRAAAQALPGLMEEKARDYRVKAMSGNAKARMLRVA